MDILDGQFNRLTKIALVYSLTLIALIIGITALLFGLIKLGIWYFNTYISETFIIEWIK